jgi:hypothetical protein
VLFFSFVNFFDNFIVECFVFCLNHNHYFVFVNSFHSFFEVEVVVGNFHLDTTLIFFEAILEEHLDIIGEVFRLNGSWNTLKKSGVIIIIDFWGIIIFLCWLRLWHLQFSLSDLSYYVVVLFFPDLIVVQCVGVVPAQRKIRFAGCIKNETNLKTLGFFCPSEACHKLLPYQTSLETSVKLK